MITENLFLKKYKQAHETCEDAFVELEVKVDFSKWVKSGFGTGDCIIVADNILEIVDLKYGKGVRVEAAGNPQMRLYALGALAKYSTLFDIDTVRMTIFQPRLSGVQSSDEISVKKTCLNGLINMLSRERSLLIKVRVNLRRQKRLANSAARKEQCRARAEHNLKLFDEAPDPLLISPEEAGKILEKAADIKAWLGDLENLVFTNLMDGTPVAGWKLIEGRSNRKLVDEEKVVAAMKAAGYGEALLYDRKLITLTQMESDFGKKAVAEVLGDLITKPKASRLLRQRAARSRNISRTKRCLKPLMNRRTKF